MKPKVIIKISVDIGMTVLLLTVMAYHVTGAHLHEWIGVGMLVLIISHLILNRSWLRNLHKGKYNALRVFQIVINLLLFLCAIGLMISGIILSRHVFSFLSILGGFSFARTLHHLCSYWSFVLMSIHIGQHWGMMLAMMRKAAKKEPTFNERTYLPRILAILTAVYGVYAFISQQFPQYMFLRIQFSFFDYEQPAVFFFLDYIAIMGLFVCIGHSFTRLIQGSTAKKRLRPDGADTSSPGVVKE